MSQLQEVIIMMDQITANATASFIDSRGYAYNPELRKRKVVVSTTISQEQSVSLQQHISEHHPEMTVSEYLRYLMQKDGAI